MDEAGGGGAGGGGAVGAAVAMTVARRRSGSASLENRKMSQRNNFFLHFNAVFPAMLPKRCAPRPLLAQRARLLGNLMRFLLIPFCFLLLSGFVATTLAQPIYRPKPSGAKTKQPNAPAKTNPPAPFVISDQLITDSFTAILTGGMAPYTLHVNALGIQLKHGTALTARYEWDFGDATAESKYNQLVGWNAAHIYNQQGTYTVKLTLTEDDGTKRVFPKAFIIDTDSRQSIYVSERGDDANFGNTPMQPVRTLARAGKLLHDDAKLLLRRGDRFELTSPIDIKHNNIIVGAYDDPAAPKRETTQPVGDRPLIFFAGEKKDVPCFTTAKNTSDAMFQDLAFDSKFTENTEKKGMPDCIKPSGQNTTVRNCVFLNVGYGINGNQEPHGVMAIDNSCPLDSGLRSYFAWVQGSDHVYLGNTVVNSTREHCLRVGGADRILLAYNNFSNLDRRPPKGNDPGDFSKGAMTIHSGSYVYVVNNIIPVGELLIGPLGKGDGWNNPKARWHWAVIENNQIDSYVYINHGTDHVMCRNNLINRNDWACFIVEGYDEQYQRGNSDITIINNTGVNRGARGNFLRVTGKVDGITVRNNLYIAPHLKLEDNLSAPVFVDEGGLSSFRESSGNIWPDLQGFKGVNYVKGLGGYISEKKWLDEAFVKGDRFQTLNLPATQPSAEATTEPATEPAIDLSEIGAKPGAVGLPLKWQAR
jgi:PKD repeat protein